LQRDVVSAKAATYAMNDAWVVKRLRMSAREALAGAYDPLLACRDVSDFTHDLPELSRYVIAQIEAVAAEAGDLPLEAEGWANARERVASRADAALRAFLVDLELSPEERRAKEIARSALAHAKDIARRTLAGDYDPLLACRDIDDMRLDLGGIIPDSIMETFIEVASSVDEYPIGPERRHWAAEALREKDVWIGDLRARARDDVNEALKALLADAGDS